MAAADIAASTLDIVSSLDMKEVPNKLKCAICSKLALNAYKLPCCAQSICETCHSVLQDSCPVCEHTPLSHELCVPHKALRNTIKAFLKTAEKKLAEERAKEQKLQAPPPPVEAETVATPVDLPLATPDIKREESVVQEVANGDVSGEATEGYFNSKSAPFEPDEPQPSIEAREDYETALSKDNDATADLAGSAVDQSEAPAENGIAGQDAEASYTESVAPDAQKQSNNAGMGFGMNGNAMPNMNMGPGGNPDYQQMMQFMSNGMMNGMGMPNMMGMPGMGMDPMSQGMLGAFGQGMGMNQMNSMNMGFDPSGGQGMFGGWNGPNNMWNGQSNNMGPGFNGGYGYNMDQQGSFQQNQYHNDFQHGYRGQGYSRGRGRGRGGFGYRGRGNYGSDMQGDHSNYQQGFHQQQYGQPGGGMPNGQGNGQVDSGSNLTADQLKEIDLGLAPGGQEETNEALGIEPVETSEAQDIEQPKNADESEAVDESKSPNEDAPDGGQSIPVVISTLDTDMNDVGSGDSMDSMPIQRSIAPMAPPSAPLGPSAQFGYGQEGFGFRGRGRGYGRFATRGRGMPSFTNGPPHIPTGPSGQGVPGAPTGPKGAPTGPKALRQEVSTPPSAPSGPRASNDGIQIMGRASKTPQVSNPEPVDDDRAEDTGSRYEEQPREINDYSERSVSHTRSHTRSPSRHRSHRSRRHHESREASDAEHTSSRRSHKSKGSRYDNDGDRERNGGRNGNHAEYTSDSERKDSHRHRDKDRHSKHRSSHRSRRHHDEEEYDNYVEEPTHHESRSKPSKESASFDTESRSSSHRGHRDRDRSSKYDSSHREDRHRDRKRSRRDRDHDEVEEADQHDSRHRSRRQKRERDDEDRSQAAPEPEKDPYTLEREARHRERLLKEQQRRDAMNTSDKGSSRRDSGRQEKGHGGSRRVSYKYEDEADSTSKGEREREAARWR